MSTKSKKAAFLRALAVILSICSVVAVIFCFSPLSDLLFDAEPTVSVIEPVSSYSDTVVSSADAEIIEQKPDCATLMFGGDILIHRSVYTQANTGGNAYEFRPFFENFNDVFVADCNSVNLESPVDAHGNNDRINTYPQFNAPIELLDALKQVNIDLCTNSNNHMIDCGFDGLLATIDNLDRYGFDHLGTYASQEKHDEAFIREINGIKVGFMAYSEYTNGLKLTAEQEAFAFDRIEGRVSEIDKMLAKEEALRSAGAEIVIAVLHWGIEYNDYPGTYQKEIAYALCEGGVDIIIGSHPHVVQPIEKLSFTNDDGTERECLVVYSLGNLFCNQSTMGELTQRGMVVAVKLERNEAGRAYLSDAFYMPTLLHVTWQPGTDFLRLVPAGKYMNSVSGELPGVLSLDRNFPDFCRLAWDYVTKTAGNDIPAVVSPDEYPEGFFASDEDNIAAEQ